MSRSWLPHLVRASTVIWVIGGSTGFDAHPHLVLVHLAHERPHGVRGVVRDVFGEQRAVGVDDLDRRAIDLVHRALVSAGHRIPPDRIAGDLGIAHRGDTTGGHKGDGRERYKNFCFHRGQDNHNRRARQA